MGLFTKDLETLDDLFVQELRMVYYAEHQIAEALPKLIEKSTAPDLKAALEHHLDETRVQIGRVEQVCAMHGVEAKQVDCDAVDGILKAGDSVTGGAADTDVRDAAIIAACQMVEHFEIARYGTLIGWARRLGRDDCASVLEQTLAEEKIADETLTRVAEHQVNPFARRSDPDARSQ